MRLRTKTILLFTAAGALIIIVMGALQYAALSEERLHTIGEEVSRQLDPLDFALTRFLEDVESDLVTLAADARVRSREDRDFTNFLTADEATFTYQMGELENEIVAVLNAFRVHHPYVSSVYMGRENGGFVRSHKRERPTRYDPRTRPWYVLAKENPGKVMRTAPYPSLTTADVNIGVVTALTDGDGGFYGVLGTDITLTNLTRYIAGFKISDTGSVLLIDENGTVLAAPKEEMLFNHVRELFAEDSRRLMETDGGGISIRTPEGRQYAYVRTSPSMGWKIVAMIPAAEIRQRINRVVFSSLVMFSAGIALLSVCSLLGLYRYILRPVGQLTESTRYIRQTGDLGHRLAIDTQDEIRELADSFNAMMEELSGSESELKESRQELQQQRDLLEERVKERTAELETANRTKSMFLANMSHEIRTPLNAILGFTQLLLRDPAVQPAHRSSLETVKRSGEHLLMLLNDVLEMSRIEAGRVTLNAGVTDLDGLLGDLEGMFKVLTRDKGLSLEIARMGALPRWIWADGQKLRQVLSNLLGNAVKFTEKGGIILRARATPVEPVSHDPDQPEAQPLRLFFEVEDTGHGISEADRERIFSQFEQLTMGSRMKGGSGLGLAICKAFVELMGGTISVSGEVGAGSVFLFDISTREISGRSPASVPIRRQVVGLKPGQRTFRILVADDNETNREILVRLLESVGFRVREAADGNEACRLFTTWNPDLVLMDLVMPVMDGFEAIQRIRSSSEGRTIPLIAVSASVLSEDRDRVLVSGADAFLKKPFLGEDVFDLAKRFLGVEYVYVDEPSAPLPATHAPCQAESAWCDRLPDDLVAALWEATVSLDVDRLEALAPDVARCDAGIAARLRDLMASYDFAALKELLKPETNG